MIWWGITIKSQNEEGEIYEELRERFWSSLIAQVRYCIGDMLLLSFAFVCHHETMRPTYSSFAHIPFTFELCLSLYTLLRANSLDRHREK